MPEKCEHSNGGCGTIIVILAILWFIGVIKCDGNKQPSSSSHRIESKSVEVKEK